MRGTLAKLALLLALSVLVAAATVVSASRSAQSLSD